MLLLLLWLMHVTSVHSQFPFMNIIQPIQRFTNFASALRPVLPAPQPQPQTQEDIVADSRLKKCCAHLDQADAYCKAQYCSLNAITPEKVLPFMAMCGPRGNTVGLMWDCVSSRHDHTPCCRVTGVSQRCMVYCEATNGVPNDPAIYMGCLRYFNAIKVCFRQYLANNPNMYGDF